jgi:hypothetical protein
MAYEEQESRGLAQRNADFGGMIRVICGNRRLRFFLYCGRNRALAQAGKNFIARLNP